MTFLSYIHFFILLYMQIPASLSLLKAVFCCLQVPSDRADFITPIHIWVFPEAHGMGMDVQLPWKHFNVTEQFRRKR